MTDFAIDVHIFFLCALPLFSIRNLFILYTRDSFVKLAKGVKFFTPIYFFVNASIIFSGVILVFFVREYFSFSNLIMAACSVYLIVSEIKRVKRLRPITSKEIEAQEAFKKYAKKKYLLNLLAIFLTTIFVYIF